MHSNSQFDSAALAAHFDHIAPSLRELRHEMGNHHCVNLGTGFLPEALRESLRTEANTLLNQVSERRDLTIESTGRTPRKYRSVGRDSVAEHGVFTPGLFNSAALLDALSSVAGEPIHRVPYAPEEFIINNQMSSGDTHGWHWDDYSYALIHIVEAPNPMVGGRVEFIANVNWDKSDSEQCVRNALENRVVKSLHVNTGETYFMKSNTTMHRISPLLGETNRIAIILSFASDADLVDASIEHTTMESIYPKDTGVLLEAADAGAA